MARCIPYTSADGKVRGFVRVSGPPPKQCYVAGCGRQSTLLCDWPGPRGLATCDRPLCRDCATAIGPDQDLCPTHAAKWVENGQRFDSAEPAR
jgi:hypothetical protein